MDSFVAAIYDLESVNDPEQVGGWEAHDRIGFAVGVVKFVRYMRVGNSVKRAPLAENVHFGPVPFLDDILRPLSHVAIGYNAIRFDNPVAVAAAVAEAPGLYSDADPTEGKVESLRERLGNFGLAPDAARFLAHADREERERFLSWVRLGGAHSRLIPPGAVGIGAKRHDVLEALNGKTFDPHAWLARMTGHPHPAKLDYLREGLLPSEGEPPVGLRPAEIDGKPISGADVPRLWREGLVWQVVDKCKRDVFVLEELLHQGLGGGTPRIFANRLNSTTTVHGVRREVGNVEVFRSPDPRSRWKYTIPTHDWWACIEEIRAANR